jgi:two-component sensor histidine kinase
MMELATEQTLPEGRLLIRELTHRLNNEIASVISIISLTAAQSRSPEVRRALKSVTELLYHSAEVHRVLQMPDHRTMIDAATYLRRLCQCLSRSKLNSLNVTVVVAARSLTMPADRCWQLGVIVYELITNAARHAFDRTGGEIRVDLQRSGSFVECKVVEDGSASANIRRGRGLEIVEELVEGLDGRFFQEFGERGSTSTITFNAQG